MLVSPTTTARPCKRGHVAGRKAQGQCLECHRLRENDRYVQNHASIKQKQRAYYIRTKERRLAVGAAWRKANPDKIRTKGREYRKNNPRQTLLDSAKDRSRTYGFPCTITLADIVIPEFCPLLGIKLVSGRGVGGAKASSPSLDRIRPHLGYVPGNVWVISYRANMAKNDLTLLELQTLVNNLAKTYITFPWDRL